MLTIWPPQNYIESLSTFGFAYNESFRIRYCGILLSESGGRKRGADRSSPEGTIFHFRRRCGGSVVAVVTVVAVVMWWRCEDGDDGDGSRGGYVSDVVATRMAMKLTWLNDISIGS